MINRRSALTTSSLTAATRLEKRLGDLEMHLLEYT